MTAPKKLSLNEFIASKKPPDCFLCTMKEREEIDEAKRHGASNRMIRDWLIDECGFAPDVMTQNKVDKHMTNRHYETIK